MFLGEAEQSTRLLAECAELAERYDDEQMRARIAEVEGQALIYQGDLTGPSPGWSAAWPGYRAVEDELGEFDAADLVVRGNLLPRRSAGRGVQPAGLRAGRVPGADSSKAYALWTIGIVQWRDHNQFEQATRAFREAIRLWQPMNDRTGIGFCVQALSWCAGSAAPDERAARLMGASRAVWRSSGAHVDEMTPYSQFDESDRAADPRSGR